MKANKGERRRGHDTDNWIRSYLQQVINEVTLAEGSQYQATKACHFPNICEWPRAMTDTNVSQLHGKHSSILTHQPCWKEIKHIPYHGAKKLSGNKSTDQPNSSSCILSIHPYRVFISCCKCTCHFLSSATQFQPAKAFLRISIWPEIQKILPTFRNIYEE